MHNGRECQQSVDTQEPKGTNGTSRQRAYRTQVSAVWTPRRAQQALDHSRVGGILGVMQQPTASNSYDQQELSVNDVQCEYTEAEIGHTDSGCLSVRLESQCGATPQQDLLITRVQCKRAAYIRACGHCSWVGNNKALKMKDGASRCSEFSEARQRSRGTTVQWGWHVLDPGH